MCIFRSLKRILLVILWAVFIVIAITLVPISIGLFQCRPDVAEIQPIHNSANPTITQAGYYRPESSTYLIFPEWYIVYSSAEYAQFLKNNRPSQFPYFAAIEQYWCSYRTVTHLTSRYPFNMDDHIMSVVIGMSLSVEYTIKGIYENTLGRLSEWSSHDEQTDEDRYAQKVASDYVTFIPLRPWFEFSFWNSLKGLWHDTSLTGPHLIRKWERKFILSLEYGTKAIYAKLIEASSHAALGTASDNVYATVKSNHQNKIITLPHEQPFTAAIIKLADKPIQIVDVAGNKNIMLSVVAPNHWKYPLKTGQVLFIMPILTVPGSQRVVILAPTVDLLGMIKKLKQDKDVTIEHIYDY